MPDAGLLVPPDRVQRWVENFQGRHGTTALTVLDGGLEGPGRDGSTFRMDLPFATRYAGLPDASAFAVAARTAPPADWGVLLVRKGGFAVARLAGRAGKPAFRSQFDALQTVGIDLADFLPKLMSETSDASHIDATGLEDPMAQTVIPNLIRVGLVPERLVRKSCTPFA